MSKPDPAGGSLENILASIRKSLAEQSTDAASEDAAGLPDDQTEYQTEPAGGGRLTQRLGAAHSVEGTQSKDPHGTDLSDLLEGQPDDMAASSDPAPDIVPATSPEPAEKDPLWFLSRRLEQKRVNSDEPARTEAPVQSDLPVHAAVVAPKPPRPEMVRASRPPFFGSSTDAGRPEAALTTDPIAPGVGLMPPPRAEPQVVQLMQPAAPAHPPPPPAREAPRVEEASRVGGPVPQPATAPVVSSSQQGASTQIGPRATGPAMVPPFPPAVDAAPAEVHPPAPAMSMGASNESSAPSVEPPHAQANAASPGGKTPSTHALEAMVVEMLQPMLRQWLDQNMPRLVAAALKDQAERLDASNRNANKT